MMTVNMQATMQMLKTNCSGSILFSSITTLLASAIKTRHMYNTVVSNYMLRENHAVVIHYGKISRDYYKSIFYFWLKWCD